MAVVRIHWSNTQACFMFGSEVLLNQFMDIPEGTKKMKIRATVFIGVYAVFL